LIQNMIKIRNVDQNAENPIIKVVRPTMHRIASLSILALADSFLFYRLADFISTTSFFVLS